MSPVVRNEEDTWGSDPEPDVPDVLDGSSSRRRQPPKNSTPASPAIPSTADSESIIDDDSRRQHEVRESSEKAVLNKTGWLLLRTTARNLTNVMRGLGVQGLQIRQHYDFDYRVPSRIHAFMLLYKWRPDRGDSSRWNPSSNSRMKRANLREENSEDVSEQKHFLFCSQNLDNASSTQALVSALLNITEKGGGDPFGVTTRDGFIQGVESNFDIGDNMRLLKAFLKPLDPVLRGATVCSSKIVRDAHNQAAREQLGGHPDLLDEDGKLRSSPLAEEMWMYSVFLPGYHYYHVYELEGIAEGPRLSASLGDNENWLDSTMQEIEDNIKTFREHNTPFRLFSITNEVITNNSNKRRRTNNMPANDEAIQGHEQGEASLHDSTDGRTENGKSSNEGIGESEESGEEMTKEEIKRIRATHNYETFFVEMMKLMGSRGDLQALIRDDGGLGPSGTDQEPDND